jgi:hypothetical protein
MLPPAGLPPEVPRLWPALPAGTRRLLAQELARLLKSTPVRLPGTVAPGTETAHAEHADAR